MPGSPSHKNDPVSRHEPADPQDGIGAARACEFAYLASPDFSDDLRDADVVLGRAWRTVERPQPRR